MIAQAEKPTRTNGARPRASRRTNAPAPFHWDSEIIPELQLLMLFVERRAFKPESAIPFKEIAELFSYDIRSAEDAIDSLACARFAIISLGDTAIRFDAFDRYYLATDWNDVSKYADQLGERARNLLRMEAYFGERATRMSDMRGAWAGMKHHLLKPEDDFFAESNGDDSETDAAGVTKAVNP